jgi:hypothetical protein
MKPMPRIRLVVERLEDRTAPAIHWSPIGPSPLNGDAGPYSGRVDALAISPNYDGQNHVAIFLGEAGGGIWRRVPLAACPPVHSTRTNQERCNLR